MCNNQKGESFLNSRVLLLQWTAILCPIKALLNKNKWVEKRRVQTERGNSDLFLYLSLLFCSPLECQPEGCQVAES